MNLFYSIEGGLASQTGIGWQGAEGSYVLDMPSEFSIPAKDFWAFFTRLQRSMGSRRCNSTAGEILKLTKKRVLEERGPTLEELDMAEALLKRKQPSGNHQNKSRRRGLNP